MFLVVMLDHKIKNRKEKHCLSVETMNKQSRNSFFIILSRATAQLLESSH